MSSMENARQSKRMEAVGQLSAAVAHDINNLLSGILGYCELLMSEPATLHLRPHLEEISSAGKRIASLTRFLMMFSRKCLYRPEVLDIGRVIQETGRLIPHLVGPEIDFVAVTESGLRQVNVDPARIKQALLILAIDLRDMLPGGGKLMIEATNQEPSPDVTQNGFHGSGPHVLITVRAEGSIHSDADLSSLLGPIPPPMKPGEEPAGEISNLYQIIELCGGQIVMGDRTGREIAVHIYLPAAASDASAGDIRA